MFRINRLYTLPETIEPVEFSTGLNIILGEKDESSDKRNSVGKSLCIEFINFALLKGERWSRVPLIPEDVFPRETYICVDFTLHGISYTIKRCLKSSNRPILVENGNETTFAKIEDATRFLTEKLFLKTKDMHPSFRAMLGPIIRDERSEFKSLIGCYDTKDRVPDDYAPHLYLLGIDVELYETIKRRIKEIEEITDDIKRIKDNVILLRQKDINDSRADLNELDDEVHSIEKSIDKLENTVGYALVKDDIITLESRIEEKRRQRTILKQQLVKLKPVSQKVEIDPQEIAEFYEHIKLGLGDLISKELHEVINFKTKIDDFQNHLLHERRKTLAATIAELEKELATLDKKYADNLAVLDQKGNLKNLKQTYAAFKEKVDQLSQLKSFIDRYDDLEAQKQRLKSEKEADLLRLQSQIQSQKHLIDDFQKTILNIHEYIQGNKSASFQIKQTNKKQVIEILMRIDSDGGHSVERGKVFIYDIALLLNQYIASRHPGLLIHDNILEVDQDTLIKSLKFLEEKAGLSDRQYILTLNSDRLESEDATWVDILDSYVRARYTKENRFLKKKYQEMKAT